MKVTVPIEVDVNLTPEEIIICVRNWVYQILKQYEHKGSDCFSSKAIIKNEELYWEYIEQEVLPLESNIKEFSYQKIVIPDEKVFNLCKAGIALITAYERTTTWK